MTVPVFVDTNVFVYARDGSEPSKQPIAADWLDHLWREELGRTSVRVLSEYYVTLTEERGVYQQAPTTQRHRKRGRPKKPRTTQSR